MTTTTEKEPLAARKERKRTPDEMSAIEKELLAVSKAKKKVPGEDHQKYLTRLMRAVSKISNDDWEGLSSEAQEWNNGAAESHKGGRKLDNFPDYKGPEIEDDVKAVEEDEAPPVAPRNVKPRRTSACHTIKTLVAKKPTISVDDLSQKLKAQNMKVSDVTIATLRSDMRDSLRVLNELGIGEFKL